MTGFGEDSAHRSYEDIARELRAGVRFAAAPASLAVRRLAQRADHEATKDNRLAERAEQALGRQQIQRRRREAVRIER